MNMNHLQEKTLFSQAWEAGSIPVFRSHSKTTKNGNENTEYQTLTTALTTVTIVMATMFIFVVLGGYLW
jgi:hypothetical protein